MSWAKKYRTRLESGEWRAKSFRDLVLDEIRPGATVLDIGCGRGFDDDRTLQQSLIEASGRYIGVEPDTEMEINPKIEVHRSTLEEAAIEPGSIDVAFAVMVLEHVKNPADFFGAVQRALKPGGVFLGFTMNRAHYFVFWSSMFEWTGFKDRYLGLLRKEGSYENYPTLYRCNSVKFFRSMEYEAEVFGVPRIASGYLPTWLRPIGNALDRIWTVAGLPGGILICRGEKGAVARSPAT